MIAVMTPTDVLTWVGTALASAAGLGLAVVLIAGSVGVAMDFFRELDGPE